MQDFLNCTHIHASNQHSRTNIRTCRFVAFLPQGTLSSAAILQGRSRKGMDVDARETEATFAGRLKQVVDDYGSANSLAKKIGRSEGALRNWLTGKSEPTVSNLVAICRETRTRVEWLVIGRGPRLESDVSGVRDGPGAYFVGAPPDERLLTSITAAVEE